MPLTILRNDITKIKADAIVNTSNPKPIIGSGCDAGIHKAAGPALLEARRKIGAIGVGQVKATPAFGLNARYVFHAVSPVWQDGNHGERYLLRRCYEEALRLAVEMGCESVAFPLLSAGNYGFPPDLALEIAVDTFRDFLEEHEMQILLTVFRENIFALSEQRFRRVESYVDEHYVESKLKEEYLRPRNVCAAKTAPPEAVPMEASLSVPQPKKKPKLEPFDEILSMFRADPKKADSLEDMLQQTDAGFSETLLELIDKTGKRDSEIYKKANVDRKLFSKIRSNPSYKPSKTTALAFAVALELDLAGTQDLIGRAGFTLTHSSKMDIIVEFFILNKCYDIHEININLLRFDQPRLGL